MKNKQNKKHIQNKKPSNNNKNHSQDKKYNHSNHTSINYQSARNSLYSPRQSLPINCKQNNNLNLNNTGKFLPQCYPLKDNYYTNRPKASTPTSRRLSMSLIQQGRLSVLGRQRQSKNGLITNKVQKQKRQKKHKGLILQNKKIQKSLSQKMKILSKNKETLITNDNKKQINKKKKLKKCSTVNEDLLLEQKQKKLIQTLFRGRGAHSIVKSGLDIVNKRKIAIKIYNRSKINDQDNKMIKNQVNILGSLNHPFIIKIYQILQSYKTINLIMQYGGGNNLQQFVKNKSKGKLQEQQCKIIFNDIIEAIIYIHSKGIAHRDIKMDNILLNKYLELKIIDFGYSVKNDNTEQKIQSFCGTPSYMAPQVVSKTPHDPFLADIWSLGILLYYMLHGHGPFKAQNQKQLFRKICEGQFLVDHNLSQQCCDLINSLLKVKASERLSLQKIKSHVWLKQI